MVSPVRALIERCVMPNRPVMLSVVRVVAEVMGELQREAFQLLATTQLHQSTSTTALVNYLANKSTKDEVM